MSYSLKIQKTKFSRVAGVDFTDIPFGRIFSDHIFIADYYDGQWRDARIVPFENFSFHPATSALHYGQAIFEGLKAYKGQNGEVLVFRPDKNISRLNKSAFRMAMPEFPEDLFYNALTNLIRIDSQWIPKNEGSSLYIRPYMYASDEYVGIKPSDNFRFAIFTCPVAAYYSQPVKVLVNEQFVRAFPGGVGTAKAAGNYGSTLYPVKLAREEGYDQLLWLDGVSKKYIQEIGTMNVFFHFEDAVVTPSLDQGTILDGITRDSVIKLLKKKNIPVQERHITIDEIIDAHTNDRLIEAFGTGTAATISPIAEIGYQNKKYPLPSGTLAKTLKQELQDIMLSRVDDPFKWMYRIEIPAVVTEA